MTYQGKPNTLNKYRLSRRGRKLQISDDQRTLAALPKDVPERTWAEILSKEEDDLVIFDIREEILEEALKIGYEHYMVRQTTAFTSHCAALAWIKLIDWYFYVHDPGEDPSAKPLCYIPKRVESWTPDVMPDPSPRDTWARQELKILEECVTDEDWNVKHQRDSSIAIPHVEEIPSEYWFPGKVNLPKGSDEEKAEALERTFSYTETGTSEVTDKMESESETLQKVTDYSGDLSTKASGYSALKTTTPVEGSLRGAGDSILEKQKQIKKPYYKSKTFSRHSVTGRSRGGIAPLDQDSNISVISDCRLRNLRLDTHYEVSSEKVDTPPTEPIKRK